MTHPMRLPALPLLGLLGLMTACNNIDCPEGQVVAADRQGTRQMCVAASDASSSSGETTQSTTETTTEVPPCDDDPACGPDEDATQCPEQCNLCGDGVVFGPETCDNGDDNRSDWPDAPPADACSEACDHNFHRCGDATLDAGEACDNGSNSDPAHSPTPPAADACAPGCTAVRFCGDATLDGDDGETCDLGPQNQSYWPEAPPASACSSACDAAFTWCGDATQNGPEACDNGQNLDPAYSPTIPVSPTPCAAACTIARFCGDTILDRNDGEACDDGNNNDGDGCSADCLHTERIVFVSSTTYKGDLNQIEDNPQQLTGLALADARCQALAAATGLSGNFKAWLSDSTGSPATRFDTRFTGLYRLTTPEHPIVASGWSGLTTKPLLHAIDTDETNALASGELVWTNTLPDGTAASDLHCNNWSSRKVADTTTVGGSDQTDPTWTNLLTSSCASPSRLYCFEDLP